MEIVTARDLKQNDMVHYFGAVFRCTEDATWIPSDADGDIYPTNAYCIEGHVPDHFRVASDWKFVGGKHQLFEIKERLAKEVATPAIDACAKVSCREILPAKNATGNDIIWDGEQLWNEPFPRSDQLLGGGPIDAVDMMPSGSCRYYETYPHGIEVVMQSSSSRGF